MSAACASTPGFRRIRKISDMTDPPPSKTYVLLDERADGIGNGYFLLLMDGFPDRPGARSLVDYPSNTHNGAGGLNFADGHLEIHRWLDPRTQPIYQKDVHLTVWPPRTTPNSADIDWLQERATGRK